MKVEWCYDALIGLLQAGSDHATLSRSADGDRLAAKIRVVPLLHGSVEGIHVDVDDLALAAFDGVLILRTSHQETIRQTGPSDTIRWRSLGVT